MIAQTHNKQISLDSFQNTATAVAFQWRQPDLRTRWSTATRAAPGCDRIGIQEVIQELDPLLGALAVLVL